MRSRIHRHLFGFCGCCAALMFLVCSFLPIWTSWYFSDWEGLGKVGSFWTMLESIPNAAREIGVSTALIDFYGSEWIKLAVVLSIGAILGRIGLRMMRRST